MSIKGFIAVIVGFSIDAYTTLTVINVLTTTFDTYMYVLNQIHPSVPSFDVVLMGDPY